MEHDDGDDALDYDRRNPERHRYDIGSLHGLPRRLTRQLSNRKTGFRPTRNALPYLQCPGEHVGIGDPPSANDVVATAPTNNITAISNLTICFMVTPPVRGPH